MAITQVRVIALATYANSAQLRARALRAELASLSAALGQAYAHSLPVDLPYIMGEVDRLAAAFPTPEEERDLVVRELAHFKYEAKNNEKKAAAMQRRRYLLSHEDAGIRQQAQAKAQGPGARGYASPAAAAEALEARGEQVKALLFPQGAPAGRGLPPAAQGTSQGTTQLIDFGPPSAEELAGYAKWNAGDPLPQGAGVADGHDSIPPTYVRHDSTVWASHIKRSEAGVELPEDLYSIDPLADPSADPFGGQDEAL